MFVAITVQAVLEAVALQVYGCRAVLGCMLRARHAELLQCFSHLRWIWHVRVARGRHRSWALQKLRLQVSNCVVP